MSSDGAEESKLDDPIWEYLLVTKIQPYLPTIRKWWENYDKITVFGTGAVPLKSDDPKCPPGLQVRMTSTPVRSPIKHIQAFPFIPTAYFNIAGVPGGVTRMITRVCEKGLTVEEFTVIEKHNLYNTCQRGQWLGIVPTDMLKGARELGKYIYMTLPELMAMAKRDLPTSVVLKCQQYLN